MGVKSLTSFLDRQSEEFFEHYHLHDCNLIIDGSSLCFQLFNWNYDSLRAGYSYECYGGDYDKYAAIVKGFFKLLQKCNIEPYIVFGGLNSSDRTPVIKKRLTEKAKIASKITPGFVKQKMVIEEHADRFKPTNIKLAVGAVCLKYVFRDVVNELNLKKFTCEEEPHQEISLLAKYLRCPVLSSVSDYFILGPLFIPFSSFSCRAKGTLRILGDTDRTVCWYVPCAVYKTEKLLHALNQQVDNNAMLFLLPILLGCDCINSEIFKRFFEFLKIGPWRKEIVEGVINWIRTKTTLKAAVEDILDHSFDDEEEKKSVSSQINHAIMVYSPIFNSPILEHFNITPISTNIEESTESLNTGYRGLKAKKKIIVPRY